MWPGEARAAALPSALPTYRSSHHHTNSGLSDDAALELALANSRKETETAQASPPEWEDIAQHFRSMHPHASTIQTTNLLTAVAPLQGQFEVKNVPGDGFCLLHAVNATLDERTETRTTPVRLDELRNYVNRVPVAYRTDCNKDLETYDRSGRVNNLDAAWIYAICMHTRSTVALMTHATVNVYVYVSPEYDRNATSIMNCVESTITGGANVIYLLQHNNHFWAAKPTATGTTLSAFLIAARQNVRVSLTPVDLNGPADAPAGMLADAPGAPGDARCCVERERVEDIRGALRRVNDLLPQCVS